MSIFDETVKVNKELTPLIKILYDLAITMPTVFTEAGANNFIKQYFYHYNSGGAKIFFSSFKKKFPLNIIITKKLSDGKEVYSISIDDLIGLNINLTEYGIIGSALRTDLANLISAYVHFNAKEGKPFSSEEVKLPENEKYVNEYVNNIEKIINQDSKYMHDALDLKTKNVFFPKYRNFKRTPKDFINGINSYILNKYLNSIKVNGKYKISKGTKEIFKIILGDKKFISYMNSQKISDEVIPTSIVKNKKEISNYYKLGGHIIPLLEYVINLKS